MKPQWRLLVIGCLITLIGLITAHLVQTSGGVTVKDIRFTGADGKTISALLYVPKTATPETKAPAILAVHGYINSRETQSAFAIEYARRGYVVLTPDQLGHGYSDGPAFANGFGGPASLTYLRTLDIVDTDNIGLEGHSMGGWTILAAAAIQPEAYKSMVLVGSSTGAPFALEGSPDWPRNLAVIFSKYDEFAPLMWGTARGGGAPDSPKLQALFNTNSTITPGRLYGDLNSGTARVLYQPGVTHPGDHISTVTIGQSITWFAQTLDGGTDLPSRNQIWPLKELGTLIALIGFVLILLGTFEALLEIRYFAQLKATPSTFAFEQRNRAWWAIAGLSAVVPVASFYILFKGAEALFPASALLPQTITTQVAFWAVLNGVFAALLGLLLRTRTPQFNHRPVAAALIAIATLAVGYLAVWLAGAVLNLDFRFWVVAVKPLSAEQARIALVYLLPFGLYFTLAMRALHGGLSVAGDTRRQTYGSNIAVMTGGFLIFLIAQYGALFTTGKLLTPGEPLNTIIMLQFVPLMLIVSLIATFTYRRTASYLPGAMINTLFVTWYIVAGQATQFAAA